METLKAQKDQSDQEKVLDQFIITIASKMEKWVDEKENVTEMLDEQIAELNSIKRAVEDEEEFERDREDSRRQALASIDTNQNVE